MPQHPNNYPKLHNAAWPGLVGKGPDSEPPIDLDTMLSLTAAAEVDGVKFDGIDLFLFDPHVSIDSSDDDLKRLADKVRARHLAIGSVVAPVWPPTGGGSAMGTDAERKLFVQQVEKACRIGRKLRDLGVRPYGVIRIDSAASPEAWYQDPEASQKKIAETFRQAADVAEGFGERLAAEGEICWGGMHSWRRMVQLLEMVGRPGTVGFQADMAHTLLYVMGYNAPEDAILPENYDWKDGAKLDEALKKLTAALRPWTIDFHVAQNNGTVHGTGSHDKTGRHCLATDPTGKLDIPRHAGYWMRDDAGNPTRAFGHVCWDGCMFPNEVMMKPKTWNDILATMVAVRDRHGWQEAKQRPCLTQLPLDDSPAKRVTEKGIEMDQELIDLLEQNWTAASPGKKSGAARIDIMGESDDEIEIESPDGAQTRTLKPLEELYGSGTGAASVDTGDDRFLPLLLSIEQEIVRYHRTADPKLTDAKVLLVLKSLTMSLTAPPGEPLAQHLLKSLRLCLSFNDYSRQDVKGCLRKVLKSVERHSRIDGPLGYLTFMREYVGQ